MNSIRFSKSEVVFTREQLHEEGIAPIFHDVGQIAMLASHSTLPEVRSVGERVCELLTVLDLGVPTNGGGTELPAKSPNVPYVVRRRRLDPQAGEELSRGLHSSAVRTRGVPVHAITVACYNNLPHSYVIDMRASMGEGAQCTEVISPLAITSPERDVWSVWLGKSPQRGIEHGRFDTEVSFDDLSLWAGAIWAGTEWQMPRPRPASE